MTNKFGLLDTDLLAIQNILSQHPQVEQAIIFGSRAKGNYKQGSDVDLALKGERLSFAIISQISYVLNETTNMPYQFDLLNYHTINTPALIEHIDRVGVVVYCTQGGKIIEQAEKN